MNFCFHLLLYALYNLDYVGRFSICRNMLILQQLLLECQQKLSYSMDSAGVDKIRSILLPRTVVLTQAYYVVMWISETPATVNVASNILENSIQRMAILKLNEPPGTLTYLSVCLLRKVWLSSY